VRRFTRQQTEEAVAIIHKMNRMIDNYAKSHASGSTAPAQHKLHDTVALAESSMEARAFLSALDDTPEKIKYQLAVLTRLDQQGVPHPTPREVVEMQHDYDDEVPSELCAQKIMNARTLKRITEAEHGVEPART
jgi:hypothetical protein